MFPVQSLMSQVGRRQHYVAFWKTLLCLDSFTHSTAEALILWVGCMAIPSDNMITSEDKKSDDLAKIIITYFSVINMLLQFLSLSLSLSLSLYIYIYISGRPLSALTCCVNVRLLSGDKKNIAVNLFSKLGWELGLYYASYDDFHPDILARMYT